MKHQHYAELDGLRGLAIVLVFLLHYGGGAQSSNKIVEIVGILIQGGWSGVTLFFVLSGFLISGIIWDSKNRHDWYKRFYMRRVLRIFPLYYASLLLIFITATASGNARQCLRNIWVCVLYLQDIPQLMARISDLGSSLWTSHLWSLAVEEQFYLLWPFLLVRMRTLGQARKLCICVFLMSLLYRVLLPWTSSNPFLLGGSIFFSRCGEMAIGAYLAMCFRQPDLWARIQRHARPVAVVTLVGFFAVGAWDRSLHLGQQPMEIYGLALISVFYGMLLVLSLGGGLTSEIMKNGFLKKMGTISYGFYLFHVLFAPFIEWVTRLVMRLLPNVVTVYHITNIIVAFGMSYLLASLSFRYFESYFTRLKNKVAVNEPVFAAK